MCSYDFFFFNDTATTEIYTLSLHDALPIFVLLAVGDRFARLKYRALAQGLLGTGIAVLYVVLFTGFSWYHLFGRSEEHTSELQSHSFISYAVFCLKKKK